MSLSCNEIVHVCTACVRNDCGHPAPEGQFGTLAPPYGPRN
jgi:hypothetical protein